MSRPEEHHGNWLMLKSQQADALSQRYAVKAYITIIIIYTNIHIYIYIEREREIDR